MGTQASGFFPVFTAVHFQIFDKLAPHFHLPDETAMTYPSIKETHYHAASQGAHHAVLVVPHGADADEFLRFFPEIRADPELAKVWPLFLTYLEIERDGGASELSHALAFRLASHYNIRTLVVELDYPRGLVDGGRLRDHCLRPCLPASLMAQLKDAMLSVHETTLHYMDRLYEKIEEEPSCFLIDIHTMATYCPVDASGLKNTFPVSFPRLEAHVDQYLNAYHHAYQRKIDLICADAQGLKLADPQLLCAVQQALQSEGFVCLENEPYHAAPIYLSYQHMQKVPSLSLDVPKHLIAAGGADALRLDQLVIDPEALRSLANCLAKGIARAFVARRAGRFQT